MHILLRYFTRALVGHAATLTLTLSSALALVVLGLGAWSSNALDGVIEAIGDEVTVTAFLSPRLDEAGTETLLKDLAARDDVAFVRYQSPRQQRERLGSVLGAAVVATLDDDMVPFGAAIDIGLRLDGLDRAGLDAVSAAVTTVAGIDGVDAVPWDPEPIAAIVELREVVDGAGLVAAVLMLFLTLGMAAAWAAAVAGRNRLLVALCRQFGATEAQTVWPVLAAAAVAGAGAAVIGLIAFATIVEGIGDVLLLVPGGVDGGVGVAWVLFVAGGPLLTTAGAWLGLRDRGARSHDPFEA
jgi:cell division protein FtsX